MEAESERDYRCYAASLEDGARCHQPRNAGSLSKQDKSRKGFSPGASKRNSAQPTPCR